MTGSSLPSRHCTSRTRLIFRSLARYRRRYICAATSPHVYILTEREISALRESVSDSGRLASASNSQMHHTPQPARPSLAMNVERYFQNWSKRGTGQRNGADFVSCFLPLVFDESCGTLVMGSRRNQYPRSRARSGRAWCAGLNTRVNFILSASMCRVGVMCVVNSAVEDGSGRAGWISIGRRARRVSTSRTDAGSTSTAFAGSEGILGYLSGAGSDTDDVG